MTFLGLILIAIGLMGLLAGLIGLALARYGSQRVRRYSAISLGRAAVLASAAAPLMVLGFIISDARRMADPVGGPADRQPCGGRCGLELARGCQSAGERLYHMGRSYREPWRFSPSVVSSGLPSWLATCRLC